MGANFAHVSPSFNYKGVTYTDKYCDIVDLITELAFSYVIQTIKQSYKVIFSMHLLGEYHRVYTDASNLWLFIAFTTDNGGGVYYIFIAFGRGSKITRPSIQNGH